MKRFLIMIAAALTVALCAGCGIIGGDVNEPSDDNENDSGYTDTNTGDESSSDDSSSDDSSSDDTGENSISDEDIQDVINSYEEGWDIDWSGYTEAEKAAIKAAAAAEGVNIEYINDGGIAYSDDEGTYQYGGEWPENEFTKLIPKPETGELFGASTTDTEFSVVLTGATIDEMKAYAEKVKAAGFTIDPEVVDEEAMGFAVYTYSASNSTGYYITVGTAMGINSITITKN